MVGKEKELIVRSWIQSHRGKHSIYLLCSLPFYTERDPYFSFNNTSELSVKKTEKQSAHFEFQPEHALLFLKVEYLFRVPCT